MKNFNDDCLRIIEEFERWYPELYADADYCYPSGKDEITVVMNDSEKIVYNSLFRNYRSIYNPDICDEYYGESEEECRIAFGNRLKHIMNMNAYTNTRLADETYISPVTISHYVNGRAMPTLYNIRRLAWALKVSVNELLDF